MKKIKAFKLFGKQYYYKNRQAREAWQTIGGIGLIAGLIAGLYVGAAWLEIISK